MIEITPSKKQINIAQIKAKELGSLNNSIRDGEGNVYGFLGEILFADFINGEIKNTYDYDVVKNNYTFDVKTKCCTSKPQADYFCSVAAFNIKQKCDFYVFVRILKDLSKAWILGARKKDNFYKEAVFYKKGESDPSSSFDWKFRADCYNMTIEKLKDVSKLKNK